MKDGAIVNLLVGAIVHAENQFPDAEDAGRFGRFNQVIPTVSGAALIDYVCVHELI